MKIEKLNDAMQMLQSDIGKGLISSDVWQKGNPESVASYKGDIKAVTLFDRIIASIEKASDIASFPKMEDYFIMRLEGNIYFIVVFINNFEWKIALDGNKSNLGLILNVTLPNLTNFLEDN